LEDQLVDGRATFRSMNGPIRSKPCRWWWWWWPYNGRMYSTALSV